MASIMELLEMLTRKVMETKGQGYENQGCLKQFKALRDRDMRIKVGTMSMQIESGVNVDARSSLMEMVATNLKCGKSCGDRITRSSKPPHVREAIVDGEDIDLDYGTMLFEEYLEAV
ncbi:hypothetical protein HAX54_041896 [Datura stramonium]|uniref:Uncharacterized protein n=1 Tax=Datura stramonium TaxID=4076 RepID=A0ABS8W0T4_DATST|nr:hypothetical protein [Datura stramonium]